MFTKPNNIQRVSSGQFGDHFVPSGFNLVAMLPSDILLPLSSGTNIIRCLVEAGCDPVLAFNPQEVQGDILTGALTSSFLIDVKKHYQTNYIAVTSEIGDILLLGNQQYDFSYIAGPAHMVEGVERIFGGRRMLRSLLLEDSRGRGSLHLKLTEWLLENYIDRLP